MSYSAIGIKFPLATYETIKELLPPATVTRTLSCMAHSGFIELYYILDTEIFSQKQKSWVGNIKTRITRKLSNLEFELVELYVEVTVRAGAGDIYTLKSLSDVWCRLQLVKPRKTITAGIGDTKKSSLLSGLNDKEWTDNELIEDEFSDEVIRVPQLIPLTLSGKEHENLYRTLCIYAKRLYYEKLFIYEYLEMATHIYVQGMSLMPKEARKITYKVWEFISQQIELHPDEFKQKLTQQELQQVKSAHGQRLQKYNQQRRANNIELVIDAVSSGKYYKSDGITLNKSSLSNAIGLNRKTIEKILATNSILP